MKVARTLELHVMMALLLAAAGAPAARAQDKPRDDGAPARREFVEAGLKAPITIFPVRLLGRPERNVGDALGLLLEKNGMERVEPSQATFKQPEASEWNGIPAQFGEFVKADGLRTRYAMYAEIVGTPGTGVDELRWVIVDSNGAVAMVDRLARGDAELERHVGPKPEPMTCCVAISERLFALTKWTKGAPPPKGTGTFERLWAEKSGTPKDAEFEAIGERQRKFKGEVRAAKIVVLPTRIDKTDDVKSATRLATKLNGRLGCKAGAADKPVRLEIAGSMNEQRVLWDFARALRDHLRGAPADAEYVVMGDIIGNLEKKRIGAVHVVVCDKAGDWVVVDFQNDHHQDFNRIGPDTLESCEDLIVERLAGLLK